MMSEEMEKYIGGYFIFFIPDWNCFGGVLWKTSGGWFGVLVDLEFFSMGMFEYYDFFVFLYSVFVFFFLKSQISSSQSCMELTLFPLFLSNCLMSKCYRGFAPKSMFMCGGSPNSETVNYHNERWNDNVPLILTCDGVFEAGLR